MITLNERPDHHLENIIKIMSTDTPTYNDDRSFSSCSHDGEYSLTWQKDVGILMFFSNSSDIIYCWFFDSKDETDQAVMNAIESYIIMNELK